MNVTKKYFFNSITELEEFKRKETGAFIRIENDLTNELDFRGYELEVTYIETIKKTLTPEDLAILNKNNIYFTYVSTKEANSEGNYLIEIAVEDLQQLENELLK